MAQQHLESLSRELSCSICLCVMSVPVARLPCCHYFCMECIQQSVRHRPKCPVCKAKVGRRDIDGDPTMDRVVAAFAKLEAHKEELLAGSHAELAPAGTAGVAGGHDGVQGEREGRRQAGGGGTSQGAPPAAAGLPNDRSFSLFETAQESLSVGVSAAPAAPAAAPPGSARQQAAQRAAVVGERSPGDTQAPPAAGGICWLAGVHDDDYQSPSVSFVGSAQRRRHAQALDARRLSLQSVQAQPQDGGQDEGAPAEVADTAVGQEAADEEGEKENVDDQQQQQEEEEEGGEAEPVAPKQAGRGGAAGGGGGAGWQKRGPKTAGARQEAAAQRQRQADGNQPITGWLKPKGKPRGRGKARAQAQEQQEEQQARAEAEQQGQAEARLDGAGSAAAAAAPTTDAAAASPGASEDLQAVLAGVHAMAAEAAAAGPAESTRTTGPGGSGAAGAAAGHATPAQPAQAPAPISGRVALAGAGAAAAGEAGPEVGPGPKGAAAARGKGRASRSKSGRKRTSAAAAADGGEDETGAAAAEEEDGQGGGGRQSGSKRSRTAPAAVPAAAGAATAAQRRHTPAISEAGTPAPAVAAPASTGGGADGGAGSSRRIPARLLPWNCAHCTFANLGAAQKCKMCKSKKKVMPAAELAAAAGATPTVPAVTAAAAQHLQDVASPAAVPVPAVDGQAAVAGGKDGAVQQAAEDGGRGEKEQQRDLQKQKQRREAAPPGGQRKQQRKMSSGAPGVASGGKRRKVDAPAAAAAEPAVEAPAEAAGRAASEPPASVRAGTPRATWRGAGATWVLLGSFLSAAGKQQLQQLAAAAGATVAKGWSKKVTHVVCGTADGSASRTFKYLMGLLAAKWVVREDWLHACLARQGPVEERHFLVAKDHTGNEGGAAAALSSADMGLPPLLHGYEIFLAGDFSSGEEVSQLLKAAGAKQLSRAPAAPPPRACTGPCTSFLLCEAAPSDGGGPSPKAQEVQPAGPGGAGGAGEAAVPPAVPPGVAASKWYQKAVEGGVPVVSHRWLLDSISAYTLQPLGAYRL